jgi:hypothetical protein
MAGAGTSPSRPLPWGAGVNLVLGFLPFILFSVLMRQSADLGLWVAFAAAFTVGIRSFLDTRVLKTLDAGNIVLFGGLALYKGFLEPGLSLDTVRLTVDGVLLSVVVLSYLLHEPFTLQYAREQVEPAQWRSAAFLRTNYLMTAVWTAALGVMTAADAAAAFGAPVSQAAALAASLAALTAALAFSLRYPAYLRVTRDRD